MSWSKLDYNWAVKNHLVHRDVLEITQRDVEAKHKCTPVFIEDIAELHLDPGGMIFMKSVPVRQTLSDGSVVSVRPELLLTSILRWKKYRTLDEAMPTGEKVIKVYCGPYNVAVMPESIYNSIGAWLALNKSIGYIARMELVEALADVPNIVLTPPPMEGEA